MSGVSVKVDDSGAKLVAAEAELGSVYLMHSGALSEAISVEPDGENRTLVCVAARSGTVLVSIAYVDDSVYDDQSWEVFPGAPLKVLASEVPETVTIEQVGSELPQIEALVAESGVEVIEREFLVLNAGAGVRLGSGAQSQNVLGWRDVRPQSGAPLEWPRLAILGAGSLLVEEDPDFNGHASVEWDYAVDAEDNPSGSATYAYPSVESLWDFLGPQGEFLWLAILKPPTDGGSAGPLFGLASDTQGLELNIDGGYRIRARSRGENPIADVATGADFDEVIEDGTAMVLIVRQSLTDGIDIYLQGRWRHLADAVSAGDPAAGIVRPVIGHLTSSARSGLKVADLRIWNYLPDTEQTIIDSYLEMAVDYGVDDTARQGHPFVTGSYAMFRANRGVVVQSGAPIYRPPPLSTAIGDAVLSWLDTREEQEFQFDGDDSEPQTLPSRELLGSIGIHQTIRSYGGGSAGSQPGQHLEADATAVLGPGGFTIAGVIAPQADVISTWRGGAILGTGGIGAVEVIFWELTPGGNLYLFMSKDTETDIEVTLPIGPQAFGSPLALMMRFDAGVVELLAEELLTGLTYQVAESHAWAAATPDTPIRLFDFSSYYAPSQRFEGFMAELCIVHSMVPDAEMAKWFAYVRRRYEV